jgi:hypothetical protein
MALERLGGIRELTARIAAVEARFQQLGHDDFVRAVEALLTESSLHGSAEARDAVVLACALWLVDIEPDVERGLRAAASRANAGTVLAMLATGDGAFKRLARRGRLPDVGLLSDARVRRTLRVPGPPATEATGETPRDDGAESAEGAEGAEGDRAPELWTFRDHTPFVRRQVSRLVTHPDPVVIARLLADRATGLRDVVRIAARRPTQEAIVRAVVSNRGWIHHPSVRYALAANPFTPDRVALPLVATCRPHLHVLTQANVSPRVHALARRLLGA